MTGAGLTVPAAMLSSSRRAASRRGGHRGEPESESGCGDYDRTRFLVDGTVQAILDSARTGEIGDGKVFVLPLEGVHRIRTAEKGTAAVTPVAP